MSDFYVGWSDVNPKQSIRASGKFLFASGGLMLVIVALFAFNEKQFINSSFSYGNQMVAKGELIRSPITAIIAEIDGTEEIIPLIGFGKHGPRMALEDMDPNAVYEIEISGTYIEYAGKKCLELTDGKESILSAKKIRGSDPKPVFVNTKRVKGEIVDPKCFFGVMNPAYGKIHKSCAIRCISGQIPPVLAIRQGGSFADFYFLNNAGGEMLTTELLSLVGRPIQIRGDVYQFKNWKIIRFDPEMHAFRNPEWLDKQIAQCGRYSITK